MLTFHSLSLSLSLSVSSTFSSLSLITFSRHQILPPQIKPLPIPKTTPRPTFLSPLLTSPLPHFPNRSASPKSPALSSRTRGRSPFTNRPLENKQLKQMRTKSFFYACILTLAATTPLASAKLTPAYYQRSCPRAEQIVSDVVTSKQITNPTTAAGTLRLFFHDCFVGGCDASVLVSTTAFNRAERDADINLSLPGDAFDAVVRAKTALELQCPGVVSCADVLALATRDLVSMLGGPYYTVRLGRKDALSSRSASVDGNLPRPNMTTTQMAAIFAGKGFSIREMVALSGAHTVGFSHCNEFANRIYNYNNRGPNAFDPSLNPRFAQALQKACANFARDPTISTFNDVMTPGKFDNLYFQNLAKGLGLLASDHALLADPRTKTFVDLYAANQAAFFEDFAKAMEKLSVYGVKTGRKGEVRRRCDAFNSMST